MKISNVKREELEEKLKLFRDFNHGKGPDPNFTSEELREIRRYQAWKIENHKAE